MVRGEGAAGAGTALLLGRVGKEPQKDSEDEGDTDDVALPFSPELGTAAAFSPGGFAVGALEPSPHATTAVVAVVSPALHLARRLDLGKVHGDVAPPHVATLGPGGKGLLVAVLDGAPHGTLVRLARIDDVSVGTVVPGAEVQQGSDDSEELSLEVGTKTALLAWDDWDAKADHEVIKVVSFAPAALGPSAALPEPSVLSPKGVDAEAPRLARRAGGFWAAWIHTEHSPKQDTPKKDPEKAAKADPGDKKGPGDGKGGDGNDVPPLAEAPTSRFVELARVDASGALVGAPLAVTTKGAHVTAFDLAAATDDGAFVVWREASTTDEQTPGGVIRLALVRADGTVEPRMTIDDDVGSGVPLLLPDDAPDEKGKAPGTAFMAVVGDNGAVRLASLDESGRARDELALEPTIGVATPLAAQAGSLFVARPHGTGLELGVLACTVGPKPVP